MQRGTFITLEGIDGTGKATQAGLLVERLKSAGYDVALFDFPRYTQGSSYFVKQYLNGAYGGLNDVSPYTAALFYALDRFEAAPELRSALDEGKIVVANRFTGSNLAHQGAKIANAQERSGFYIWLDNLEFQLLGIPRPNLNIILEADVSTAQKLVGKKGRRSYTDKTHDIHEADQTHLTTTARIYEELAQLFPRDFQIVDCMREGAMLDAERISALVWGKVEPLLPAREPADEPAPASPMQTSAPAELSVLATMNRLRRHGPEPVATVVPGDPEPWFVTPERLKPRLRKQYVETLQHLRETYLELVEKAQTHAFQAEPEKSAGDARDRALAAAQHILPLATRIPYDAPMNSDNMSEVSALKLSEPDAMMRTVASLALPTNHADQAVATATLLEASPSDEFELLPDILYQFSDQPLEQIRREVATWPADQKAATLRSYLMSITESGKMSLLDSVTYSWDLISDVATFLALASFAREVRWQPISPRIGYDIPDLIEQAGLSERYEECFDLSLELYSKLQRAGFATEAQYACLLGHRLRWSASCDLKNLIAMAQQHDLPGRENINLMLQAVAEQHPLLSQIVTPEQ